MRCPCCNLELQEVIQSLDSLLNEYQWESVKAGDYYCINCKPELVNKFYNKIGKESPLHD